MPQPVGFLVQDMFQDMITIVVTIGPGKYNNAALHFIPVRFVLECYSVGTMVKRKDSITVFARSCSHISRTLISASSSDAESSLISKYLPIFTSSTSSYPKSFNAWWTVFPCGSRTPSLNVTCIWASILSTLA